MTAAVTTCHNTGSTKAAWSAFVSSRNTSASAIATAPAARPPVASQRGNTFPSNTPQQKRQVDRKVLPRWMATGGLAAGAVAMALALVFREDAKADQAAFVLPVLWQVVASGAMLRGVRG